MLHWRAGDDATDTDDQRRSGRDAVLLLSALAGLDARHCACR